jgi:integrase
MRTGTITSRLKSATIVGAGTELVPANVYRRVLAPAAISVGMKVEFETIDKDGEPCKYDRSKVSFHTFRHTCASMLFEAGRNVKQVSEWLGHTDPSFTLRTYVHLMDEGVGDAEFFDEAVTHLQSSRTRPGTVAMLR